ncbi:MAG: dihydrolipoamide acetyltransferase family protein [Gammaproteobacteria bacterium]
MTITAVTIPKWGIEMQEATFSDWHVELGAEVSKGDELADLETDKIVNVAEAPASGILRRRIAENGDVYSVGVLIAVIADANISDEEIDAFVDAFVPIDASFDEGDTEVAVASTVETAPAPLSAPPAATATGAVSISPIARRLAEKLGVDWSGIQGTGNNGRISKQDIEAATAAASSGSAAASEPLQRTGLQRTVATRMTEAKQQIPHFYLRIEVELDRAETLRSEFNERQNAKLTMNDVLLVAVGKSLEESPAINVQYRDGEVYSMAGSDVGVAIASQHGLVAPVIRDVAKANISAVSHSVRALSDAADKRELKAEHFEGGATTVSNLGSYGVSDFVAIINPPQTSILAVGRAAQKAVVRDGQVGVAISLTLNLSCDHRAFDGAAGAGFLRNLKQHLEQPDVLFGV